MSQAQQQVSLSAEMEAYFRDQLRAARAIALSDAEGYRDIVLAIERLGYALTSDHDGRDGLGKYENAIREVAQVSLGELRLGQLS